MKKRIIILGSTGSIGQSTLDVVDAWGDEWEVAGLAAGSNAAELAQQANRYRPEAIALANGEGAEDIGERLDYRPVVLHGPHALRDLVAQVACDCVVTAVVGADGLAATLKAAEMGRRIALANKEPLVMAGPILLELAERHGAEIIPVDSEHSAVFQALQAGGRGEVLRIWLTASGGPFRTWSEEAMADVTLEDALRHPTWSMGPKITIDSATMMNKALEIVEAKWLFGLTSEQIEVVVHPESIVHSLVEFLDGSLVAQLGAADMRTPIQYALSYPQRRSGPAPKLDLFSLRTLRFHPPDVDRFPALRLGHEVAARGGTSGAVLNAANEAGVQLFREGRIRFRDIVPLVENALQQHQFKETPTLDELIAADRWARNEVNSRCLTC